MAQISDFIFIYSTIAQQIFSAIAGHNFIYMKLEKDSRKTNIFVLPDMRGKAPRIVSKPTQIILPLKC